MFNGRVSVTGDIALQNGGQASWLAGWLTRSLAASQFSFVRRECLLVASHRVGAVAWAAYKERGRL